MEREKAAQQVSGLFETCYSSVVRYAFRRCGSLELAEEFTQEAFGAYYVSLREERPIENPRAWIVRTVLNQIYKHWRYQHRHPEELLPKEEMELFSDTAVTAEEAGVMPQGQLSDFLALLTPREEEAILLRAKGLKYREIADRLGISSNSAGTLILRAVRRIRAARDERIGTPLRAAAGV